MSKGEELIRAHNGQVTGQVKGIHMLTAEMPKDQVRALAAEDAVQWIEQASPPLTEANDGTRDQIHVEELQLSPYSLYGTGVDVLVYDSGQVGDHIDFGDRLIHGDTDSTSEHSTHVAGIIGGTGVSSSSHGGSFLQWRGMAFDADLISYGTDHSGGGMLFYENVPDIEHDFAQAQNWFGADLANFSVLSNIYANYPNNCYRLGNYGASSILLDQIVRGENSLVGIGDKYITVAAAGNERNHYSSCSDLYATIPPPASAKNPIHVGGADTSYNYVYTHSSWGPTDDGRIKPTVVSGACQANGDFGITSTDNNPENSYTVNCGTSMAAASVTGGIALMLQHYRNVYNTTSRFWPSTAKALLIQTAVDIYTTGPDYKVGYGLVNIQAAVDLITEKAFRQAGIGHGEVHTYYYESTEAVMPFTVSLAWDDYEATFNANPALVNNLNLEAVAPDGTLWLPWVLDPAYPANGAWRSTDNRNNQEQVRVYSSLETLTGIWTIRVKGISVPQGPQDYSLVCNGKILDRKPANPISPGILLPLLSYSDAANCLFRSPEAPWNSPYFSR